MIERTQPESAVTARAAVKPPREPTELGWFVRSAAPFALIGLVLYAGLYAASEQLIDRYALRNRFYLVKTAPRIDYDYVILGASHAVVFDGRDMNARLEEMTGRTILNLATAGGGITVNRLLLEYFLDEHRAKSVVYAKKKHGRLALVTLKPSVNVQGTVNHLFFTLSQAESRWERL